MSIRLIIILSLLILTFLSGYGIKYFLKSRNELAFATSLIFFILTILIGWLVLGFTVNIECVKYEIDKENIEIIKGDDICFVIINDTEKYEYTSYKDYCSINEDTKFYYDYCANMYGIKYFTNLHYEN